MQKTKSNTKKTFVYQFETHFLIESATDNNEFYFSDKDYLSKSNIFFSKLDKDYVEVVYLNSQPSIVPSLYFEENIKSKYIDTNTVVSKSIVTDTSSDGKIKVVLTASETSHLSQQLMDLVFTYTNNLGLTMPLFCDLNMRPNYTIEVNEDAIPSIMQTANTTTFLENNGLY